MKKNGFVIIDPKGNLWMRSWWVMKHGPNGAWHFLKWSEDKEISKLKEEGYTVRGFEYEVEE